MSKKAGDLVGRGWMSKGTDGGEDGGWKGDVRSISIGSIVCGSFSEGDTTVGREDGDTNCSSWPRDPDGLISADGCREAELVLKNERLP